DPLASSRWRVYGIIFLLLLLAAALRIPGLLTDFWLDEVWTWALIRQQVTSWTDVFTKVRMDNSHPLVTLLMHLVGDQRNWMIYRIPSYLAGVATIPVAARIGLRRGACQGVAVAAVFALSYPMIVYSTEARGYAPVVFFALLSLDIADQFILDQ